MPECSVRRWSPNAREPACRPLLERSSAPNFRSPSRHAVFLDQSQALRKCVAGKPPSSGTPPAAGTSVVHRSARRRSSTMRWRRGSMADRRSVVGRRRLQGGGPDRASCLTPRRARRQPRPARARHVNTTGFVQPSITCYHPVCATTPASAEVAGAAPDAHTALLALLARRLPQRRRSAMNIVRSTIRAGSARSSAG